MKVSFNLPHPPVSGLQHSHIQAFFATKIVVNHALAGAGGRCDFVNTSTSKSFGRKLFGRHAQDFGHGPLRVVGSTWAAGFARG